MYIDKCYKYGSLVSTRFSTSNRILKFLVENCFIVLTIMKIIDSNIQS